jgi:AraC-like DNA-binding protein
VAIVVGDELLGLAKCVCGPEITKEQLRSMVRPLEDMIARPCLDLEIFTLRNEIHALHADFGQLRRVKQPAWPTGSRAELPAAEGRGGEDSPRGHTLMGQVLEYLGDHFADTGLSLSQVARAVGKNEKYVAHLFAQQIGERMRTYITRLRVGRACELLLQTRLPISAIAGESGFAHPVRFRHSFRRVVGVTASEYRRIFGQRSHGPGTRAVAEPAD